MSSPDAPDNATDATTKKKRRRYSKEEIIKALTIWKGMVYLAAKALGCHAATIYRAKDRCPSIAKLIEGQREELVDTAEIALLSAVGRGEGWAVCFALKCQGKKRGYVEKDNRSNLQQLIEEISNESPRLGEALRKALAEDANARGNGTGAEDGYKGGRSSPPISPVGGDVPPPPKT